MPLLKTAQSHSCLEDFTPAYIFDDSHKTGWEEFWKSLDGDIDKVLDFAKKAKISHPEDWVNALHAFLFSTFSGNPKLLKKAAKSFKTFLTEIAKQHVNNPKKNFWYSAIGTNNRDFIRIIEHAATQPTDDVIVSFINARIAMNFGARLYSEYLLASTNKKVKIKSIASKKNKEAYELEKKHANEPLFDIGDTVELFDEPGYLFEIQELDGDSAVIMDDSGKESFVDLWDLEKV